MKPLIPFKTIIPPLLVFALLVCFSLSQTAQAIEPDTILPNGNTAEGNGVLVSLTSGVWNSGFGFEALNHDNAGKDNTATGVRALFSDTSGSNNIATGVYALYSNTTGWYNNAVGAFALANNTEGNSNTANGYGALYNNAVGKQNTATGFAALYRNTANYNTATGYQALNRNTGGSFNTANGFEALFSNMTGNNNAANGAEALFSNTTGSDNTASGNSALGSNSTGNSNTAIGESALSHNTTGGGNTAIGLSTLFFNTTGGSNTALGVDAGGGVTTASNVICIGANVAGADVSNSCFIGNINGVNEGGTISAVYINSNGQLGTQAPPSSRRFKKGIKPMDQASEAILALRPVTFHYKSDNTATPQFGLIAEEVAAVNPNLVVRDADGEIYTVRYDQVNAMLLNEFLKEHRKVEEQGRKAEAQEATITQLKKGMEVLTAHLEEQASQIQKVSAEVEMGKRATKVVLSNR